MLVRVISQHAIKRLISALRSAHHGATILLLPTVMVDELGDLNRFIDLKYRFDEGEPRRRFPTLVSRIMNRVAELNTGKTEPVGWTEYALSNDEALTAMDEAIFEMAYLVAGCAEIDGAVVLTQSFELMGFGGEISGELPGVVTVRRALDLEGNEGEEEFTESVGTRHRSAYRLSSGDPGGGGHRHLAGRRRALRQEPATAIGDVLGPVIDDLAGRVECVVGGDAPAKGGGWRVVRWRMAAKASVILSGARHERSRRTLARGTRPALCLHLTQSAFPKSLCRAETVSRTLGCRQPEGPSTAAYGLRSG